MLRNPIHPLLIIHDVLHSQVKLVPVSLPQSTRKREKREETITKNIKESGVLLEPELNSNAGCTNSHPLTRNKLWDHAEEDLPLLDSPLEVDSETPVADALIRRLQDEEEKQEGMYDAACTQNNRTAFVLLFSAFQFL